MAVVSVVLSLFVIPQYKKNIHTILQLYITNNTNITIDYKIFTLYPQCARYLLMLQRYSAIF